MTNRTLKYLTWLDVQDGNVEPCPFASAVAQHYARWNFQTTARRVQNLIDEAEDARSPLLGPGLRSDHTLRLLQYMAERFQRAFGHQSRRWLRELRVIHEAC